MAIFATAQVLPVSAPTLCPTFALDPAPLLTPAPIPTPDPTQGVITAAETLGILGITLKTLDTHSSPSLSCSPQPSPSFPPVTGRNSGFCSPNLDRQQVKREQEEELEEHHDEQEEELDFLMPTMSQASDMSDIEENEELEQMDQDDYDVDGINPEDAKETIHLDEVEVLLQTHPKKRQDDESNYYPEAKRIKQEQPTVESEPDEESGDDSGDWLYSCNMCDTHMQGEDTLFMHTLNIHCRRRRQGQDYLPLTMGESLEIRTRMRRASTNSCRFLACYECMDGQEFSTELEVMVHMARRHDGHIKVQEGMGLDRIEVEQEVVEEDIEDEEELPMNIESEGSSQGSGEGESVPEGEGGAGEVPDQAEMDNGCKASERLIALLDVMLNEFL